MLLKLFILFLAIFNSVMSLPSDKNNKPSGITPPKKDFDINKPIDHASSPASGSHSSGSHYSFSSQGASQSQPSGSTDSKSRNSPTTKQRISNAAQHKRLVRWVMMNPPRMINMRNTNIIVVRGLKHICVLFKTNLIPLFILFTTILSHNLCIMSVYVLIQYYPLLFLVTVIACFAQMIDLNKPPAEDDVNVHSTQSRPHSFDLNIPDLSQEENIIKQSEPLYIKPLRTPAPQRTLKGKRDEAWNDKMRETLILRKKKREREQQTSTTKALKPKKGSLEWKNKISQGMQRYLKRIGKDEYADRKTLRLENKKKKDLSSKLYFNPGGEK